MPEKQNQTRNLNLGWLHTCDQKYVLEIISVGQYIKIDSSGFMFAMKPPKP